MGAVIVIIAVLAAAAAAGVILTVLAFAELPDLIRTARPGYLLLGRIEQDDSQR